MIDYLIELLMMHPEVSGVLSVLGALMSVAQIIVAITPSPKDDAFLEKIKKIPFLGKILQISTSFAPVQKKPKK